MLALLAVVLSISSAMALQKVAVVRTPRVMKLAMAAQSQVLAAQPTAEEWLDVVDPGLKKATLAMFRACKEIAYKIRTASCDKMACFNEFGKKVDHCEKYVIKCLDMIELVLKIAGKSLLRGVRRGLLGKFFMEYGLFLAGVVVRL